MRVRDYKSALDTLKEIYDQQERDVKTITTPEEIPSISNPYTIFKLQSAAARCHACPLWQNATQTVFGDGPVSASVVLVGEQPGNDEDLGGKPFIGPAGKLLDRSTRRGGYRTRQGVCDQRCQTFQVGAARQKTHPQKAQRSRRLPSLA
jgi:uracil-DNA glycosylase